MSCHPNYDDYRLASPEDYLSDDQVTRQEAEDDLFDRVTACEQAVHAACPKWPGRWTAKRLGKVEKEVSLTPYDHDKSRFHLALDVEDFYSLEDLHQSLLLFADIVSQHMR